MQIMIIIISDYNKQYNNNIIYNFYINYDLHFYKHIKDYFTFEIYNFVSSVSDMNT